MLLPHERSNDPVGSPEELELIKASKTQYGSCSEPCRERGSRENVGCPYWMNCQFKNFRNASGGKPPISLAVYVYKDFEKTSNTVQMNCFQYYASGMHLMKMDAPKTKDVVKVVAVEGDGRKFKTRVSRPLHVIPDRANCPECARGECRKRVTDYDEKAVVPFSRPSISMAVMAESHRVEDLPEIDFDQKDRDDVVLEMGSKKRGA